MRTTKDIHDLRVGFSYMDSSYLKEIEPSTFMLYLLLRRFTWRSEEGKLGQFFKKGVLVARIKHKDIAEKFGTSSRSIRYRLDSLKQLGWIKTQNMEGRELIYILGKRIKNEHGIYEMFYADAQVEKRIVGNSNKNE